MSLDHMGHMSSKNGCRLFSLLFGQSSIITLEVIKVLFFAPFFGWFFFNEEISFNREVERKLPLICRTHATSFPRMRIVCSATKQVRRIATFYISYPQPSDEHSSRGTFSTHGPNRSVFILECCVMVQVRCRVGEGRSRRIWADDSCLWHSYLSFCVPGWELEDQNVVYAKDGG